MRVRAGPLPAVTAALVTLLATLAAAGCDGAEQDRADPPSTVAPRESSSGSPTATTVPAPAADPLVVVTHATRPRLHLNAKQAADLVARRGTAGVAGTVRAVERDPAAVGVVPLSLVGPTVVTAEVDGRDPVRDREGATTLVVTGDVMLVRGVPDPRAALAPMRGLLRSADLTVGNLESTLSTDGAPTQGGDSFGGSPALVPVLADAGFDALSLANNHTGDYGDRALVQTVDTLRGSRIRPFGAGRDLAAAARPAVLTALDGTTFAFLGFNAIGETPRAMDAAPGALSVRMPPRTGPLVEADLAVVERAVRAAQRRVDVVVVLPHWGTQYTHLPEPVQRTVSRRLVAAGADLVVGGHPHWVQGVDAVDGVPVLHSLGNFVFDMDHLPDPAGGFMTETMEGVVLQATFWGPELKAVRLLPYRMDAATFAPHRIEGRDVLADVWSASTGPFAG
jgi:poly-gamma-glutamate capsule biosynthesis protein CapA/YwtB (metallophosphatase superfamily)